MNEGPTGGCEPDTDEADDARRRYREEQERQAKPLTIPPAREDAPTTPAPNRELVPA